MKKQLFAALLCVMMVATLLPTTALAADATVQYLVIGGTESEPTCTYKSPNTADGANGVLITGGDTAYTLNSSWDGAIIVNGASVTYNGSIGDFYVLGSGKLTLAEGAVEVTRGSYEGTYSGSDGSALLTFIGGIPESGKIYSYNFKGDYEIVGVLDACDVTVAVGKTLTVKYDNNTSGDNPSNPDAQQSILRVAHSLIVNGTLAGDSDQRLELGENATVSGVTLYDGDGASEYTLQSEHFSETFAYTNTAAEGQSAVWRWVHQEQGSGGPTVPEDGKFTIDWDDGTPQSGTAAMVTYKIGSGSAVTAVKQGEGQNAAEVEIADGEDLTITYKPRSDAEGFWGFRVTKRGDQNNTVTDVTDVTADNNGIYSYTITREATEKAGLLVEILDNDPNQGGDQPPQQSPGFLVRYDSNALTATYKSGEAAAVSAQDMQDVAFPASGSVILTFGIVAAQQGQPENHFYGIVVFDGENRDYIKAGSASLPLSAGSYTYTITDTDFDKSLEIEAISQPAPFDNEYMVEFEALEEASVSVNNTVLDNKAINDFTTNTPVVLTFSADPHKVLAVVNGSNDQDVTATVSANAPYTLSYTATTVDGFTLRVYWTQAEYNYAMLHEGDNQFMVEYRWNGDGNVTHNSEAAGVVRSATYGKSTKVVLANGTETFELTMESEANQSISEVRQDGTLVDVSSQTHIFSLNNNRSNIEVNFTGGEPGPGGETYTITPTTGANGSIVHYVDNEPLTGDVTVHDGDDCFFDIIPAQGYVVESITIDGNEPLTGPFSIGTERYEFQNVRENHTISATFAEYVPEAHSNDPKTLIDRKEFAYSGADAATIKAKFVEELWYTVFSGNTQQGAITTKELLAAAITLGNEVSNTTVRANGKSYDFTVELGESAAAGVIYTLNDERDFVVKTTKGGTDSYTVVPYNAQQESAYTVIKDFDENGLYVFGNGTFRATLETSGSGIAAGHILNIGTPTLTQIGCQLVVYKPGFTGTKMQGVGEDNYAAAWGFAQFPVVGTGGTTQAAPAETELYFGNSSATLSKPETPGLGVAGIANVESLLPDGAVTITSTGTDAAKTFSVTFNSAFYDVVNLKITYDLTGGGTCVEYLNIRRVGIEIVGYGKHGDNSISTNHGTDPGYQNADFWSDNDDNYAVFGTYYHPTVAEPSTQTSIQLYATYTWQNGTVTTALLSSVQHLDANNMGNSVATDDFVLWRGNEADAPIGISVTAVKPGSDETTFSGAALGSGAGVEWVYVQRT